MDKLRHRASLPLTRGILGFDSHRNRELFGLMPFISTLASRLHELLISPLPLLTRQTSMTITLSQIQIASLLANAFLSTFPTQPGVDRGKSYGVMNLESLLSHSTCPVLENRLNSLLRYFQSIKHRMPSGCLTFSRVTLSSPPDLINSPVPLSFARVQLVDSVQNLDGQFSLLHTTDVYCQHAFVNDTIENTFFLYPELLVSILFTENLSTTEGLLVAGCERFSVSYGPKQGLNCDYTAPAISDTTP